MKDTQKAGCVLIILSVLIFPAAMLLRGWVIGQLWGWFVVPTFHLPTLSIPVALGIGILFSVLHPRWGADCQKPERTEWEKVAFGALEMWSMLAAPLWMLGVGWVIRHWM